MKIDGSRMSKIINNYGKQNKNETQKAEKNKKKDELSLSNQAQELQNIKEKVDYKPQIRQEKVASLKKQIKQGTYDVDGEEVAKDILDQVIDKRV
ncbi:hypothetical protein JCM16358_19130 [Halanaerocella petrolearia]